MAVGCVYYLCKHLSSLQVKDPFLVPNSEAVADLLQNESLVYSAGFSVDVVDLYNLFHTLNSSSMFSNVLRRTMMNAGSKMSVEP